MRSEREFSLLCCPSIEPAWNTKIWVKIISAYEVQHNQVFVAEGSRGEEGGGNGVAKNARICFLGALTHRSAI